MCCGYYKPFTEGNVNISNFYKRRYQRILPFFAFLVFIDVITNFVQSHFSLTSSMQGVLCEAFANITLLFGLLPKADISVIGVGWFLGVIFVFYLLFPFFTFLIHNRRSCIISLIVSIILFFLAIGYFSNSSHVVPIKSFNILYCAPYFIVGGIIFKLRNFFTLNYFFPIIAPITLCYTLSFFIFPQIRLPLFSNLLLYTLWIITAISRKKLSLLDNRITAFLSSISMEVYLCHMLFFRVIEKIHLETYLQNHLLYISTVILTLCGAICFAVVFKKIESLAEVKIKSVKK